MANFPLATAPLKPRARQFADYWLSLPRTDLIPHRRDFDPAALVGILDTFMIFEMVAPDHFLIRLAGTTVIEHYGREITGMNYLDFRTHDERPITQAMMPLVATQPCGQLVLQSVRTGDGKGRASQSFGLPMRDDNGEARLLFYQVDYTGLDDLKTRDEHYLLEQRTVVRHFMDIGNGFPDIALAGPFGR